MPETTSRDGESSETPHARCRERSAQITSVSDTSSEVVESGCRLIWTLRIGACACFAGWAWQHLRWSVPYDAVLWNPDYMDWLAQWFGVSWESYVADVMTDRRILIGERIVGLLYLALAIVSLTAKRNSRVQFVCLGIGGVLLAVASWCKYLNAGRAMAMFVEHGGQILAPAVLILALQRGVRDRWTIGVAVVAFCATFAGHGIYAAGLAPTPGHFYGMVSAILGFGETAADHFLKTVGVLDFVICVGLAVPVMRRACLAYAALWGLLTALARPVAGLSFAAPWWGADQFVHEAVLRAPHVSLPLFLFLVTFDSRAASPSTTLAQSSK